MSADSAIPSPAIRLHLALLGEIQLSVAGRPAAGKVYGKMLALLAYLALENQRSHRREQLADLLWPALPAAAARINLRQTLFHLRRMLGDSAAHLLHGRETVRLQLPDDCWLDVRAFLAADSHAGRAAPTFTPERIGALEAAVALYRGDFLAHLEIDDAAEFEGWRDGWRTTLQQHMLRLLETLRDALEQQGASARALDYARRYLTLEPWNEAAQRAVMRLLAGCGRPAEALAQYQQCQRILQQELGSEADDATHALASAIRMQLRQQQPDHAASLLQMQAATVAESAFAERRQVTILHCCLSANDSSDAEEIAELLRQPYRQCAELARRHGGHVLAAPGGSFVGYFGYPVASEDAAHSAVRAARAIHAACPGRISVRSGLHSATIVTGSAADLPDPAGIASALAARLCERAGSDEIHLSSSTRQLVSGYFHLQPCGSQALPSYRVTGSTGANSRLDAAGRLQPLVGRAAELAQLLALSERASRGQAQHVLLRGEAGIGKSRLLRELAGALQTSHAGARWLRLEMQCEAAYQYAPWQPIIHLLERLIGARPDDSAGSRRRLLTEYLDSQHAAIAAAVMPPLQALLGIAATAPAGAGETLRQQTSTALLALFRSSARQHAVLLTVEDLHWADPSTLALLVALQQQAPALPLLLIGSVRNEAPLLPELQQHCSVLELAALDPESIRKLVRASQSDLPPDIVERVVASAEGIPLFAEELAQQAVEQPAAASVPATLAYLLAARLDATGAARRLAQCAATIGRSFDLDLLAQVSPIAPAELQALLQARLLEQRDAQRYAFRHALIHVAAYQSQTRSDRQQAHRRVADALLRDFPRRVAQQPAQLAHHLGLAGDHAAALSYWLMAGRQALAAHACAEAVAHLRSGLAALEQLPASPARGGIERDLLLALGQALLALTGYGSAEAASVYERAYALCQHDVDGVYDAAARFDVLWGLWMVSSSRAQASFRSSAELIAPLLQSAAASADPLRHGHAHAAAANQALWQGRHDEALAHAQTAIRLCDGQPRPPAHQHGHDPQVAGLAYAAWARQALGQHAAAREAGAAAIALARQLEHPDSLCFALVHAATVYRLQQDGAQVAAMADEILALAGQYQLALWQVAGTMLRGWSLARAGQPEGIALLEYAASAVRSVMPGILVAFLHPLAEAHGFLQDYASQLTQLDAALASADLLDEHLHRPSLLQLRAACLQQQPPSTRC